LIPLISQIVAKDEEGFKNNRLYVFAFPTPFPSWTSGSTMEVDQSTTAESDATAGKRVSFTTDTKPETSVKKEGDTQAPSSEKKVDGAIGQLEFYRSGAVKIRLQNNILLEVGFSSSLDCILLSNVLIDERINTTFFLSRSRIYRLGKATIMRHRRS
jgi:hypothetical protein